IAISADAMTSYNEDKVAMEVVSKKAEQQIRVQMTSTEDGMYKAVVTTIVEENGAIVSEDVKEFTGATEEEVKAAVEAHNQSIKIE
ncbi:MAG: sodium-translocating pyrophosphatase, partial [Croceitalea sp.]|nr:sodium-translocating pyrophosphatase [Croceitalea sp.]